MDQHLTIKVIINLFLNADDKKIKLNKINGCSEGAFYF